MDLTGRYFFSGRKALKGFARTPQGWKLIGFGTAIGFVFAAPGLAVPDQGLFLSGSLNPFGPKSHPWITVSSSGAPVGVLAGADRVSLRQYARS